MKVKDLVFGEGNWVRLARVENGHLIYSVLSKLNVPLIEFKVPPEDQLGATFSLIDTPKVFMRWIRKEIERQDAEEKMIAKAREDWQKEIENGTA